jgi:hypothetical protein
VVYINSSKKLFLVSVFIVAVFYFSNSFAQAQMNSESKWVYTNAQGKLSYKTLAGGDKIMDFSYAGYMGGGVSIPSIEVKLTVSPATGDNTDIIQNAIDEVSQMKLVNGFRGAVLLKSGTYNCDRTININASGAVLCGIGSGEKSTIINVTGKPHLCISVKGSVVSKTIGAATTVADVYVPSDSLSFNLTDVSGFAVGDTIRIIRPVTETWVKFMGMDQLVRNGKKQTWVKGEITCDRIIKKIEKNKITVDVPLTDSYDSKYLNSPGTSVVKISITGELSQIGIENFRIVAPPNL